MYIVYLLPLFIYSVIGQYNMDNPVTLDAFEALLERKIGPLRETMADLKDSVNFLSHRFDTMESKVSSLECKVQEVDKENKFLKAEVLRLSKTISEVEEVMSDMQQYTRRECCEIAGIPMQPGEDTNDIVVRIGSLMGLELEESDISVSHRLPVPSYSSRMNNSSTSRPRSPGPALQLPKIIVKFVRRDAKEKFFKGRKFLRGKSTADLGLSRFSENKIYVSESLSPRNKAVFKECLEFKNKFGFKFIWTQQGRTYIRKDADSPARLIKKKVDLERIST